MSKEVDIGKCFADAWDLYKNNFGIMILSTLIATLVGSLTCGILYAPLFVGLFWIIDRLMKNDAEKPTAGDVFKGMSKFGPAFICLILFTVIYAIAGAIPVIGVIAAYIISPMMMFALMYIAFEDMDAIAAIKRVFQELFSGDLLMPVVVGLLAGLVGSIGAIACVIGMFFTMPLTGIIYVCAYYQIKGENEDIMDAEIVSSEESTTGETQPDATPPQAPQSGEQAKEDSDDEKDDEKPTS